MSYKASLRDEYEKKIKEMKKILKIKETSRTIEKAIDFLYDWLKNEPPEMIKKYIDNRIDEQIDNKLKKKLNTTIK